MIGITKGGTVSMKLVAVVENIDGAELKLRPYGEQGTSDEPQDLTDAVCVVYMRGPLGEVVEFADVVTLDDEVNGVLTVDLDADQTAELEEGSHQTIIVKATIGSLSLFFYGEGLIDVKPEVVVAE